MITTGTGVQRTVWEARTVRATMFPVQMPANQPNWWQEVVGEEPSLRTVRPRERKHLEEGDFERGRLRLSIEHPRIDWLLNARELGEGAEAAEAFESLGSIPRSLEPFASLVQAWLRNFAPEAKRLAFGAVLFADVANRVEGYRALQRFLPAVRLDENASDFMYQINRGRRSATGVEGLEINRISKWSVSRMGTLLVSVQGPTVTPALGPQRHSLRLELDINTAAEFPGSLPQARLADIYAELVRLGMEIAVEGDVP